MTMEYMVRVSEEIGTGTDGDADYLLERAQERTAST